MPEVPINYLAVFVSGLASMVLGFLWYGFLFNKTWMRLSGMTESQLAEAKAKGMTKNYILEFIGALIMSYVLAYSLAFASDYLQVEGALTGLVTGFWNWLGFIAPVTLSGILWENKSWKLWLLNNAYYLVSLSTMSVILALWI